MDKKQLATCEKVQGEKPRSNGRTRWETQRISGRSAAEVDSRAAKNVTDDTPRASALVATVDKPKHGLNGKHRQGVRSKPQSSPGVCDSVNLKL